MEPGENVDKLAGYRARIDEADREIVRRLLERAEMVARIGESKRAARTAVYRPDRERQIYENTAAHMREFYPGGNPPMPLGTLHYIYREIMSAFIVMEGVPTVFYPGPVASACHEALRERLGHAMPTRCVSDIGGVFRAIQNAQSSEGQNTALGIVPISSGSKIIAESIEGFCDAPSVQVYAEHRVKRRLALLGPTEISEKGHIKKIYATERDARLTDEWCKRLVPDASMTTSGMLSASHAADLARREGVLSIGSPFVGENYGLSVLDEIQGDDSDYAKRVEEERFFLIGPAPVRPTGNDATTLLVKEGGRQTLESAGAHRVSSVQPAGRQGILLVDLHGHADEPGAHKVIEALRSHGVLVQVLGSYPNAADLA